MATTAELERLDALIDRLTPLTQAARGELIIADNWNTIVSTLIELGRAVYSEATGFEVPEHTHIDEVSLAWLDTQLRTLISGGSLNDPVQQGKLNTLERKITRINSDVSARLTDINAIRAELDRLATRELTRESSVQNLDRRVDGLRDSGEEIGQLRLSLDTITGQITTMQSIADQLSGGDGEIIDVAALQQQVNTLSAWREQLRDANGELLTGIGIDQKIAEALNTLITEDELELSLDSRLAGIEDNLSAGLDSRISTAMDQRLELTLNAFRDDINSEINRQFEGLDSRVAQAVADELPGLQATLEVSLQSDINDQVDALRTSILNEVDTRSTALRSELLQADQALRDDLSLSIDAQIEQMQSTLLAEVDTRTNAVLTQSFEADQALRDEVNASINNQLSELQTSILTQVNARTAAVRNEILELNQSMRDELSADFSLQIATFNQSLATLQQDVDRLNLTIGDRVLQVFNEQLTSGTIISEASRASMMAEVRSLIDTRIGNPIRRPVRTDTTIGLDDFTAISGISAARQRLLQNANIRSYADLAQLTPEQVARITRIPLSQVVELDIIGQAQRMRTR